MGKVQITVLVEKHETTSQEVTLEVDDSMPWLRVVDMAERKARELGKWRDDVSLSYSTSIIKRKPHAD